MNANRVSKLLLAPLLLLLLAAFALSPRCCADAFLQGLLLCGRSILPSLFPFFVVSNLLTACPGAQHTAFFLTPVTRLCGFRQKEAALLLLLSWTGGYAVCAHCLCDAVRRDRFSAREAGRFAVLGTCTSPGFVLGLTGGGTGRVLPGLLLYLVQLAGCVLCALCLRPEKQKPPLSDAGGSDPTQNTLPDFSAAMQGAIRSALTVCGYVLFFGTLSSLLRQTFSLSGLPAALLCAFWEIGSGCSALIHCSGSLPIYWLCALFSLFGVSVWLQLRTLGGGTYSLRPLLVSRPLHLGCSLILLRLAAAFLPGECTAFSTLAPRLLVRHRMPGDCALLLFILCCGVLREFGAVNGFTKTQKTGIIKQERSGLHVWQSKKNSKGRSGV